LVLNCQAWSNFSLQRDAAPVAVLDEREQSLHKRGIDPIPWFTGLRCRVKAWSGCADVLSFRHTYFDPTISREALPVAYQSLFRLATEGQSVSEDRSHFLLCSGRAFAAFLPPQKGGDSYRRCRLKVCHMAKTIVPFDMKGKYPDQGGLQ
jgi:hypothetical protein